jgi:hypothetical protein
MSSFTLIEDLIDFTNELIYLIKQDWEKFKIFVKEYKKYVFWIIVLLITMQFTDLMSIGSSWEKYCKQNGINSNGNSVSNDNIQKGGSSAITAAIADAAAPVEASLSATDSAAAKAKLKQEKTDAKTAKKTAKKEASQEKAYAKKLNKNMMRNAYNDNKSAKKDDIKKKAKQLLANESGSESKDIDKKLSWFKNFKANLGNGAGPVFGNIDRILKYTEAMFVILTSILIVVGVLSLPVLIFLIITYCVIKMMVGKFMIL